MRMSCPGFTGGLAGYDVPVAQSTTFRLKPYDTASDDDDASVVDEANAYAEGSVFRSQAGAGSTVDDPGGGIDDPGGGDTDDFGSFGNRATPTTTSSKTSVSSVSSSLTTGFSLLSLSDKSAVDVVGNFVDVDDCATDPQCLIHRTCVRSRESIGHDGADLTENLNVTLSLEDSKILSF